MMGWVLTADDHLIEVSTARGRPVGSLIQHGGTVPGIVVGKGGGGTPQKYMDAMVHNNVEPREMVQFGAFTAPLGALMSPEDRLGGALRGFAGGALGGLGWRAGGNLARAGQAQLFRGAMGGRQASRLLRTAQKPLLHKKIPGASGQRFWKRFRKGVTPREAFKTLGTRAALGVVPTTAAFAGAHAAASPIEEAVPGAEMRAQQMQYYQPTQQPQQYQPQQGYQTPYHQTQRQVPQAYHDLYQQGYY